MRPLLVVLLILTPVLALVGTASAAQDVDDAIEQARDSVVTVYTYRPGGTFSPGRTGREPSGSGSGWVYAEGLVITNAHVIDDAEEITVVTTNGDLINADLVGSDWYQDVAVLRLEPDDPGNLPPSLPIGVGSEIHVGDPVVAIGTPHGQFADTISEGEVLAVGQRINTGVGYSILNLIQHSATLAPGNSGGPLMDDGGYVIGMNVASRTYTGEENQRPIGFAIAIDAVVPLVEEIIETGDVEWPWLGVTTEAASEGTIVTNVEEGSPAEEAGIARGDRIVGVGGEPVSRVVPFIDLLYRHQPGETVTITIERDGAEREVRVELEGR